MSLTVGSRIGHYEVLGALGAGGMGEVYRARDTKLGREVAVKVLPDAVAEEPDRVARFEREAKSLAALHHPHIATLFGLEQDAGRRFLVMELVAGETVSERLGRGPLPVPEALAVARQIADALEAAHERGIIHRDLKPANIKLAPDDVVKVLDFGLAKAMERDGDSGAVRPSAAGRASFGVSQTPTLTTPAGTVAGMILGTAAYMSPEQAKGMPADHRSDVFAFGAVLYELLTGTRAFPGDNLAEILAWVLARDPDWTLLPSPISPRLISLLQRCLAKSRRERWQAIGDVRAEIEFIQKDPFGVAAATGAPARSRSFTQRVWPIAVTAIVAGGLAGSIVWMLRPGVMVPPLVRFQFIAGADQSASTNFNRPVLGISRDGSQVAFAADKVYLRPMTEASARPLAGTDGFVTVTHPAFSPDGRSIVFWGEKERVLKRLDFGGGSAATLCPLSEGGLGLDWAGDAIYFGDSGRGILRVAANGGPPEVVAAAAPREEMHGPQLLPDGETLLYTLGTRGMPSWDAAQVVAQSLRTGQRRTLVERATNGRYLASGHLVFGRGGLIMAVPFDVRRLVVLGQPVSVVEGVRRAAPGTTGVVHFAVSDNGTLAYVPGVVSTSGEAMQLALFDRAGAAEPVAAPLAPYNHPRMSPDGTQVAVCTDDGKEAAVWIYSMSRTSAARRLTFGGRNRAAEWTADGGRVAFQSDRDGDAAIWWQRADGTDTAARLTRPRSGASHLPRSWSRDGRHLLFDEVKDDRVAVWDLSIADGKTTPFLTEPSNVPSDATFSPDGRWVAYTIRRNDAASAVVYLEPYPRTGARYQISKDVEDGHHPAWSPDGRELFYTPGPGSRLMVVSVTTTPTLSLGEAVRIPRMFTNAPPSTDRTYDVARDGKRFLGLRTDVGENGQPLAPQVQVVLNWFEELKRRVPVK